MALISTGLLDVGKVWQRIDDANANFKINLIYGNEVITDSDYTFYLGARISYNGYQNTIPYEIGYYYYLDNDDTKYEVIWRTGHISTGSLEQSEDRLLRETTVTISRLSQNMRVIPWIRVGGILYGSDDWAAANDWYLGGYGVLIPSDWTNEGYICTFNYGGKELYGFQVTGSSTGYGSSPTDGFNVPGLIDPPVAPTNFMCTASSDTSRTLTWTNITSDEAPAVYTVIYREENDGNRVVIAGSSTGGLFTTFTDSYTSTNSKINYYVQNYGSNGVGGDIAGPVTIYTTPATPNISASVSNTTITAKATAPNTKYIGTYGFQYTGTNTTQTFGDYKENVSGVVTWTLAVGSQPSTMWARVQIKSPGFYVNGAVVYKYSAFATTTVAKDFKLFVRSDTAPKTIWIPDTAKSVFINV